MHVQTILAVTATLALVGCPDPAPSDSQLLGSWTIRDVDSDGFGESFHFADDGTVLQTNLAGEITEGTFVADGQTLELADDSEALSFNYLVEGDRLWMPAFLGTGDGVTPIGVWRGTISDNGDTTTMELAIRADHTASVIATSGGRSGSADAEWSIQNDLVELDLGGTRLLLHVARGALAMEVLERD